MDPVTIGLALKTIAPLLVSKLGQRREQKAEPSSSAGKSEDQKSPAEKVRDRGY